MKSMGHNIPGSALNAISIGEPGNGSGSGHNQNVSTDPNLKIRRSRWSSGGSQHYWNQLFAFCSCRKLLLNRGYEFWN